jgi:hypothetical protein
MILSRIGHFPHGTAGVDSEMNSMKAGVCALAADPLFT